MMRLFGVPFVAVAFAAPQSIVAYMQQEGNPEKLQPAGEKLAQRGERVQKKAERQQK